MDYLNRYPVTPTNAFKKLATQNPMQSGIQGVNTAFPGQNMGLNLEQVKEIIANSEKIVGVVFVSAVGEVTPNIKFPATAKYLLGFSFSPIANTADTFNMKLNEENAIALASSYAYSTRGGSPNVAYFEFLRIIGGSTSMDLTYKSAVGGETIVFTAHYV